MMKSWRGTGATRPRAQQNGRMYIVGDLEKAYAAACEALAAKELATGRQDQD